MRKIKIFDTTLRDGEQSPGCSMNLTEKLEMAHQLDKLGVDVIEAGFAISSPDDFAAIQAISRMVEYSAVASLSRAVKADIDRAWEAVKEAKRPVIHTFLATSDIHMEYKLKMTREQVLQKVQDMVGYARSLCPTVEFSAEDASRSDRQFLASVLTTAIEAGATTLNVPDTVGYATPSEMFDLITYLRKNVKGIDQVDVSVHCHNDLGLAVANTLASVEAGATQVECTINGIGERAGNASLEEVVMVLMTRKQYFDAECGVDTRRIYRSSRMLSTITGVPVPPNKAIVGKNAFAHEAGIHQHGVMANAATYEIMSPESIGVPQNKMVLGKHSGRHAFSDHLKSLGYDLTDDAVNQAFTRFKEVADKKKEVTDQDIEALISVQKTATIDVYTLEGFVVNSGNTISAMATVSLKKDDEVLESVASGAGPIDAAFAAIDKITKTGAELKNYSIQSVTEGEDALGEVIAKLTYNGHDFTGRGLSTDIIEASLKAYINGVNKICAEQCLQPAAVEGKE